MKGVSFIVSLKKGRKVIAHAFIARVKAGKNSSHVGVFIRKENAKHIKLNGKWLPALPIDQRFGPDIKMLIGAKEQMVWHEIVVKGNYDKLYAHELSYYLKQILK